VLLCDLVGSTALAAHLDPEEWREAVAGYQRVAAEAIARFGGYVARYVGDGVLAFFGYPEAHDNDAERAVHAGLALLEGLDQLNRQTGHAKLSARIGIDSGPVVVGGGTGQEADVFGDAPNIAARVQAAAAPGTVSISEAAQRLVAGLFIVEALGAQTLKGIERPIELYRVVGPSGISSRLEAAAATGRLTPFVGRGDEVRLLLSRWERVNEGEGQVVTIIGEAGIGKSRLLQRFREEIADEPYTWLECATAPFFQNTPFYAAGQQSFHWGTNQSAEQRLTALEASLASAGLDPYAAVPLIAPFLELPVGNRYPPLSMAPDQQRKRLLATLVGWAFGAAKAQPLVIAIEDLHWVDPSSLELIQLLVEQGATARLLFLCTARPEFRPPWPPRSHHTQLTLNRLSAREVRTMVGEVAMHEALSNETVATVVERTGGVPLFVEELTRAVLESGDAKLTGTSIPVTLHDSLMARLDRLGPAKEVAQIGAVLGHEFSYELLHAVHPIPEPDLQGALRTLTDAELLYVRGIAPEANYHFKHALIRDAAYEALLKSRRKELHRLVARTIDEKFPTLKETRPEVLARHWTEAGEIAAAISGWSRAGNLAEARSAFNEALEGYRQALEMLALLPESPESDLRELELRRSVVSMLQMIRGYAAPETITATEQAIAIAEKSANLPKLMELVNKRWSSAYVSGDLEAAAKFERQALELARREGSTANQARIHARQIQTRYMSGDLAGAENQFTSGLTFFSDAAFRQDPGTAVSTFGWASWNAWTLGRADTARERMDQMMASANSGNPYEVAFAETFVGLLQVCMKGYERAAAAAKRALDLSETFQFPYLAAVSRCILGQARAHLGHALDGVRLVREGIAGMIEVGSRVSLGNLRLADAQECAGAFAEALQTIEQALEGSREEVVYQPEMLRLRGELHLKRDQPQLAETDYREAIRIAQNISAKAWELRATTSLARLLVSRHRRDEARKTLAEIYNWFTEGFDTADLKDAKALLDQLNT
jgi:class 3 adenylate cyclase/tetratricopeptide (TPR) repeat protein